MDHSYEEIRNALFDILAGREKTRRHHEMQLPGWALVIVGSVTAGIGLL